MLGQSEVCGVAAGCVSMLSMVVTIIIGRAHGNKEWDQNLRQEGKRTFREEGRTKHHVGQIFGVNERSTTIIK